MSKITEKLKDAVEYHTDRYGVVVGDQFIVYPQGLLTPEMFSEEAMREALIRALAGLPPPPPPEDMYIIIAATPITVQNVETKEIIIIT